MSEPYTPHQISIALRAMSPAALATVTPRRFHLWPTRNIVPSATILELIGNEQATRGRVA